MTSRLSFASIDPRDVPADVAARRLGLTAGQFAELLPRLLRRGFPCADPTTGNFDIEAIDEWRRGRRKGLGVAEVASPAVMLERISQL